jgi:hypothetical protein
MEQIVLVMKRKTLAEGFMRKMESRPARFHLEQDYEQAGTTIRRVGASAALVEAGEDGDVGVPYCLTLCAMLRDEVPACKLLLFCSERDKEGIRMAVAAKLDGSIDDFVFYDAGMEYLCSKLLSM